ncbi:MAG TPA: hypothetical protein VMB48_09475 [Steroidobacteraceae bacterium]|nr:hypothetical protein [Steroidobacteraceae bacterium]
MWTRGRHGARRTAAGLCLLAALARNVVLADGKPPPDPDMDLIEFLGSVDSDDAQWQAWLKDPQQGEPAPQKVSAPPAPAPKPAPKNDDNQSP